MPKKQKPKAHIKKPSRIRLIRKIREKVVSGFFSGIEDFIQKATISLLGAVVAVIGAVFLLHSNFFTANIFSPDFPPENTEIISLIEEAAFGEVIFLPDGHYIIEEMEIDEDIRIVGLGEVIISGNAADYIFRISKDRDVRFSNIVFEDAKSGIVLSENTSSSITSSSFRNMETGIEAKNAAMVEVSDSLFTNINKSAISFTGVHKGIIEKNTLQNTRIGLQLDSSEVRVQYNLFQNITENGIYLFNDNSLFTYNIFRNIAYGSAVNFRKGVHASSFRKNIFQALPIAFYSIEIADTGAVSILENLYKDVFENRYLLPDFSEDSEISYSEEEVLRRIEELEQEIGCHFRACVRQI